MIRSQCDENEISAKFDEQLEGDEEKYIILKPDAYYNTINFPTPLPSVDCLIIVKCDSNQKYDFYLIELKNIKSPAGFNKKNIVEKFKTVIEDFLTKRFGYIFLNYRINSLYLFFISDPYRKGNLTDKEYEKIIKGLKLEFFQSVKPLVFKGKEAFITPVLPNSVRITPC